MSVTEGITSVKGKLLKVRLHTHQDPDPERGDFYGGPKGHGYIEGPMEDIKFLAEHKPAQLVIDRDYVVVEILQNAQWEAAEVMWRQDGYEHGVVHLTWT